MSDEQPLYINAEHWLRRRPTDENIKIDKIIEACEPQLRPTLETIRQQQYKVTTREQLARFRERTTGSNTKSVLDAYHARYPGSHLEHVEWSFEREGHIIGLTIFRPPDDGTAGGRSCVYYIHSGGFIFGNRWSGIATIIRLIHDHNVICVTVEYRLAPEWNAPTQLEDCYHGLVEVWKQRESLGINDRLLLVGRSAGANLAAGVALRVRDSKDEEKLQICGQMLSYPMLDHTNKMALGVFSNSPAWTRKNNIFAWQQLLRDEKETVTIYTVPGSAALAEVRQEIQTLTLVSRRESCSQNSHDDILREIQSLRTSITAPDSTNHLSYADVTRTPPTSQPSNIRTLSSFNTTPTTFTDTLYCTIDTSKMADKESDGMSAGSIRATVEKEIRTMENHIK